MGSYRCSTCGINYPDSKPCRVCGVKTDYIYGAGPTEDWKEEVARRLDDADSGAQEYQRLVRHRMVALLDLGFSAAQVDALPTHRADVHHDANALLKRGASHAFVVHELAED